jgi:hypothetical protein
MVVKAAVELVRILVLGAFLAQPTLVAEVAVAVVTELSAKAVLVAQES